MVLLLAGRWWEAMGAWVVVGGGVGAWMRGCVDAWRCVMGRNLFSRRRRPPMILASVREVPGSIPEQPFLESGYKNKR